MKKRSYIAVCAVILCALILPQLAWADRSTTSTLSSTSYNVELVQVTPGPDETYSYRFKISGPIDAGAFDHFGATLDRILFLEGAAPRSMNPTNLSLNMLGNNFTCEFTIKTGLSTAKNLRVVLYLKEVLPNATNTWESPQSGIWLNSCELAEAAECIKGSEVCVNDEKAYGKAKCVATSGVIVFIKPQFLTITPTDSDGDGIPDIDDNCPDVASQNQTDSDNDGKGDACDEDIDGDGVLNMEDNCPLHANAGQEDVDGDNLGDACDSVDDSIVGDGGLPRQEDVLVTGESSQLEGITARAFSHCALMPHASVNLSMLPMLGFAMLAIAAIRRRK